MVVEQAYRSTLGHGRQRVRLLLLRPYSARNGVRGSIMLQMVQLQTPFLAEQIALLGYECSEFDKPMLGCNR